MNWQILRALPRISCMKASWVFVVGGKIQKFLRVSISDPKVSSETCWRCCTRENVRMLGISLGLPSPSCHIQGGAGVYPRTARYAGEKQSASSTALAPEGGIGRPTCTPAERLAPDNTESAAADMGLACSEWVNICRPQTAIQICRGGIGWLGPGRLPSWRVTGYEVTGNKLKHREMAAALDEIP